MMTSTRASTFYKFLHLEKNGRLFSEHGNHQWTVGQWYEVGGTLKTCVNGFHASIDPFDALKFVKGNAVAIVEIGDNFIEELDKVCASRMRVVKAFHWSKKDSVELAMFSADLVLPSFEKRYPNDERPRRAVEAAKAWLGNPTALAAEDVIAAAAYAAGSVAYGDASYAAAYAAYAAYAAVDAVISDATQAAFAAVDAVASASDVAYLAQPSAPRVVRMRPRSHRARSHWVPTPIKDWLRQHMSQLNAI